MRLFKMKKGSSLILLLLVIAGTSMLGVSLMTVTMVNYKVVKASSEMSQAFYMAEYGLNRAYGEVLVLIEDGIEHSLKNTDTFIKEYPCAAEEAENIFKECYKIFVVGRIRGCIEKAGNPRLWIINSGALFFDGDSITVSVKSEYRGQGNVVKIMGADMEANVPDYGAAANRDVDIESLLALKNWNFAN